MRPFDAQTNLKSADRDDSRLDRRSLADQGQSYPDAETSTRIAPEDVDCSNELAIAVSPAFVASNVTLIVRPRLRESCCNVASDGL